MLSNSTTTVAQIAANSLAAVKVFEKFGIDYCCGGKRPLGEVCQSRGLSADQVQAELDAALAVPAAPTTDWNQARLSDLAAHIVRTHHDYLRNELPFIAARLEKVSRVYNQRYGPTLVGLPEVFGGLRSEIVLHIGKEERILFPFISRSEEAYLAGLPLPPTPFGGLANPIRMMEVEHDEAGAALARIREITADFSVPEYACVTYKALISGLQELEQDLHLHIHLENNILFPRALKL